MPKFDDAREIEQLAYQIRLADYPRGLNRMRIDELMNGWPPYTDEEAEKNNTAVNVNFLEGTRLAHDARSQFNNAFLKPGNFFTLRTDYGSVHRRAKYAATVTKNINRVLKRSVDYFECFRSKFALTVLHGIGPSNWRDSEDPIPEPLAIADVGIPARTYLTMRNLPFFYIYRSFTAPELMRLTRGPKVDPGWNKGLVDSALEWLDKETMQLMGSNWPEVWAPEKASERVKGDGGFYVGDQVPTLDAFDFYYLSDEKKHSGWRRRIILDSWSTPQSAGGQWSSTRKTGEIFKEGRDQFLYNGHGNKFADDWKNIMAFQFADLSAVAPFQYHSVRSLGFLLYSILHLQNRLRCAFSEAVFENLLQMFRIKSMDDVQRALTLKLHGFAFIDDTLTPVPANERFQPNMQLVELGLQQNSSLIQEHSSSWVQNQNFSRDRTEKTKFQVMAEVNAMTTLVSAGLNQAYAYQTNEYNEIVRRFMNPLSQNPTVRLVRGQCLKQGVPPNLMRPEVWDCEPERVMGAGNKTLEMTIAQQLMEWRPLYNPSAQNQILRDATLAITDDPGRADMLVPEQPHISDSVHDAELAFGTLMAGSKVTPKPGLNSVEIASTIIRLMADKVQMIMQTGGVGTRQDVIGLGLAAQYAGAFIKMLSQDEKSKPIVKKLGDALGKIMNEVKAMAQRQQQAAQQAQQNGNGGLDPKDKAKILATQATAQQKVQQMRDSHAARTAERKIAFQEKLKQDEQKHRFEMQKDAHRQQLDVAATDLQTAAEIKREEAKAAAELKRAKAKGRNQSSAE